MLGFEHRGRFIPNGWTPRTKQLEAVLMELTIRKLPRWLETYMRNLNPDNFKELREAIVRYLGSQK